MALDPGLFDPIPLPDPLPDWDDERGVALLADAIIAEADRCSRIWTEFTGHPDEDEFDKFMDTEKDVVKAALRGDVVPLAKLLLDENWQWLQLETRRLISAVMLGKHRSGKVGRPKKTPEERRAANVTHRAEETALILRRGLRELYPGIAPRAVRKRAMEIAAKRTGVPLAALQRQLNRSRKDPHHIS